MEKTETRMEPQTICPAGTVAPVINGDVAVGDTIAFGCRDGNTGGIRMAEVLQIKYLKDVERWNHPERKYETKPVYKLKVHVTKSAPWYGTVDYETWVGTDLVVRMS